MHGNMYQEADFDENNEHHVRGSGRRKDDEGSSSDSDFEYITEDSLLGHKSSLPSSRKASTDQNYINYSGTDVTKTMRKVCSDGSETFVDCDFKDVGCEARLSQSEMSDHLKHAVVYHLSIQIEAIKKLRTENKELTTKYERLEMKHQQLESRVNELVKVMDKLASTKDLDSEVQPIGRDGASMLLDPQENSSECGLFPSKPISKSVSHSLLPTVPKVTARSAPKRPMSACFPQSSSTELASQEDDGSYINEDERPELRTIKIGENDENWHYPYIPVESTSPLPLEIKQQSQKSVKLIVTNFEKYRMSGGSWFSRPFYTHSQGYKMCLRVTANGQGSGKGTHTSVAVYLMKGEFDDQLEWPFRGDITIQLLNQQGDKKEHFMRIIRGVEAVRDSVKSGEKYIRAWGISQFKSHGDVYKRFLKKDCLKFQIIIVIKPPTLSQQTIKT